MSTLQAWREEARQDRLTQAQIDRDRETARIQARIAERQANVRMRREEAQARAAARTQARKARAARRAARSAWLSRHTVDLLFVPVVLVPAVLAWTAMASYGYLLYGPAGLALPALSEGGMWTFAAAVTITRRKHPDKPVWHLRAGTVVFAAIGAALNFAHGITAPAGHGPHGLGVAVVYAVVSAAGVTAHQFVTAGPRRSRAERDATRIARAITRREHAARRAAIRRALVDLDERGNARLLFESGTASFGRRGGRTRLDPAPDGQQAMTAAGPVCPWPRPVPLMPASGAHPVTASEVHPADAPAPAPSRKSAPSPAPRRTRSRAHKPVTEAGADVHFAADLASGQAPSARRIRRELRVGQPRANEIRQHLENVLNN